MRGCLRYLLSADITIDLPRENYTKVFKEEGGGGGNGWKKIQKKSIRPAPQKPPLFWNAGWLLFVCGNAATFPDSIILLCFSHVAHPKMRPKIKIKEAKKR